MTPNPRAMTPNQVVRNPEAQEVILSTSSGQIGVLSNHAPPPAAPDIGTPKIRIDGQWSIPALMGGPAVVDENRATASANEADEAVNIDPQQAREVYLRARAEPAQAKGGKQTIEANSAFRRAKARLDAVAALAPERTGPPGGMTQ
uniref:ATP synthase epsilon chain, chloroplastic n=2 Tax=Selaginella TaxID=3246 RepID=A0A482A4S8_SELUN|nr:ATP synthase CF1 epsilon subunit [Selaginella uncinata]YP_009589520.1 ATP synthase CF1 epsilon subunit [Selaginella hainanensis]QBL07875.1 ATP synthase CF1 epsilon subunit [Selaginella uncinata]QBL76101.1 ATP synthase CF1 epsilon subunit [Selaginella hainanensis]